MGKRGVKIINVRKYTKNNEKPELYHVSLCVDAMCVITGAGHWELHCTCSRFVH